MESRTSLRGERAAADRTDRSYVRGVGRLISCRVESRVPRVAHGAPATYFAWEWIRAFEQLLEFQEAVDELHVELQRLSRNVREVTEYQVRAFQATKVLCSWMGNIEGLARHRAQLPGAPSSSR
ncbi:hypothetical protein GDO78_019626 [Eleutherodactylus coqui]|uniref:Uncharacterized protein n=1 Tax=Eleutherodactylus coqui TaxID=57060 RepID=A0A8J6JU44_ELECQ|nr:hypothetical protein GDO78_019626 [Eleutherodactylus coqui]